FSSSCLHVRRESGPPILVLARRLWIFFDAYRDFADHLCSRLSTPARPPHPKSVAVPRSRTPLDSHTAHSGDGDVCLGCRPLSRPKHSTPGRRRHLCRRQTVDVESTAF